MSFADKVDEERPRLKWRPSLWVATGIVAFGLGLWLLAGAFLPPTQRATMIWDRGKQGPDEPDGIQNHSLLDMADSEAGSLAKEFNSDGFIRGSHLFQDPKKSDEWKQIRGTLRVKMRMEFTPERHVLEIIDLAVRGGDWAVFEELRRFLVQEVKERETLAFDQGLRGLEAAMSNQEKQAAEQTDAWWKNYYLGMVEPYKTRIAEVEAERAQRKPPEIHLVPAL